MKGYVVCVYKNITNEEKLNEYAIKARAAVEKYKGKFELPKKSELDSKYCMKLDGTGRIDDDIIENNFSILDYLKYIGIFLLLFIFFYYLFMFTRY